MVGKTSCRVLVMHYRHGSFQSSRLYNHLYRVGFIVPGKGHCGFYLVEGESVRDDEVTGDDAGLQQFQDGRVIDRRARKAGPQLKFAVMKIVGIEGNHAASGADSDLSKLPSISEQGEGRNHLSDGRGHKNVIKFRLPIA